MIGIYTGQKGELNFESDVVELLTQAGWDKNVIKNPTHKDLEDNLRNIINENNIDKLGAGTLLTDNEFAQIMDEISMRATTPVAANVFLNGKQVVIQSEIARTQYSVNDEIYLDIFDPVAIAGGKSRYQIAEQPIFKTSKQYNDRRGDILLLINGLPVIQIELKASGHDIEEGIDQIQKYMNEGVYNKLFGLIQVFFVMTPEDAVYFANPYPNINKTFVFHWGDISNHPVHDWQKLIIDNDNHILSIPEAHQLIGYYTSASIKKDSNGHIENMNSGILMTARSYQVHAIRNIIKRVAIQRWDTHTPLGGYVWGTTGCGKTFTSYKAGHLIIDRNYADKVIFVVDRKELDNQSFEEYSAFARDGEPIKNTKNTHDLFRSLKNNSNGSRLIITSIQKLARIDEDKTKYVSQADIDAVNKKRIVFIVDEAHRSQFGEMHRQIKNTFINALFIGFTGTPIFSANNKMDGMTSEVTFGDCLAVYSIASGIRDKNVLGFYRVGVPTFKDDDLRNAVACDKANVKSKDEAKADPNKWAIYQKFYNGSIDMREIEAQLPSSQYNCDTHRNVVVEDILSHWDVLSNVDGSIRFHALLATNSISEAIQYYHLFRPTNLKVTALFDFSVSGNNQNVIDKENAIIEIVDDYNKMFDTNYDRDADPSLSGFKRDVMDRLSHKGSYKNISDDDMIDIVIVVDQLLTGFDSKYVNTLYLDKVLDTDALIQAISRTNRVIDFEQKPWGIFKYYRMPYTMKQNIDDALKLYCEGGEDSGAIVANIDENVVIANKIFADIVTIFKSAKINDFMYLPKSDADRRKFKQLFKNLNQTINCMKLQDMNWKSDNDQYVLRLGVCEKWIDGKIRLFYILQQRYNDAVACDRTGRSVTGYRPGYDLAANISEIENDKIDADYLEAHFKQMLPILIGNFDDIKKDMAIKEFSAQMALLSQNQQKFANIIIDDIRNGKLSVDGRTLRELIAEYQTNAENQTIIDFADKYGLNEALVHKIYHTVGNHDIEISKLCDTCDQSKVCAEFNTGWFIARAKLVKAINDFIM